MAGDSNRSAGDVRPWNVFVSSTVKDFEMLRAAVRDDLGTYAEAACFLSENWVGGFDDTIAKCRARVKQSDAFMLLLGYWYGSIPPGSEKSVTHIEFDSALEKWSGDFPPVAVMRPRDGSDAGKELAELAKTILDQRALEPGFDRSLHDQRRLAFRNAVINSWRTVNEFSTRDELTKKAITCALRWQGKNPARAAAGLVSVDVNVPSVAIGDAELGRLGRDVQLREANELLAVVAAERSCPGIALVVHGAEDAGQAEFMTALAQTEPALRHFRPGTLPGRHASVAALTSWAAQSFGLQNRESLATPEALADAVFVELKHGPLGFILNRIAFLDGGLQAFASDFWTPLCTRLQTLGDGQPFQHQLVIVVSDASTDAAVVNAATNSAPGDDLLDYSKPLRLSPLEDINRKQLLTWLKEQRVPGAERAALADTVLKDDHGNDDRVPSRVFRRLREQWPHEETPT